MIKNAKLLIVLLIATLAHSTPCDTTNYENFTAIGQNKTIATTKNSMTWNEAKTLSENSGGTIFTPLAADDNNYTNNINGWIGVYDPNYTQSLCLTQPCIAEPNRFSALNSSNYRNWTSGQPNNYVTSTSDMTPVGNHFAYIQRDGTWSVDNINAQKQAIVEFSGILDCVKSAADPATTPTTGWYCTDGSGFGSCNCSQGTINEQGVCQFGGQNTVAITCNQGQYNSYTDKCESGGVVTEAALIGSYVQTDTYPANSWQSWSCRVQSLNEINQVTAEFIGMSGGTFLSELGDFYTFDVYCNASGQRFKHFIKPGENAMEWDEFTARTIKNISTPTTNYSCNSGDGNPVGTTCYHSYTVNYNYCNQGQLSGNSCSYSTLNQTDPQCIYTWDANTGVLSSVTRTGGICYLNYITSSNPTCSVGSYACKNASDASNTQDTDTTQGSTDKNNNGQKDASGNCLGNIYIFNGKDMRCRKQDFFGLSGSCCNKSSVLAGLIQCKPEEKNWAKLVDAKKGHYVGEYCSKKFLGICQTKKETWCTFNSQLARIIHEQGRQQLNIGWGSAESPICRGLKPDEFQKLDFSKIDLSEFVQSIQAQALSTINSGAIQQNFQQNINYLQGKVK